MKERWKFSLLPIFTLSLILSCLVANFLFQNTIQHEKNNASQIAKIQASKIQRIIENKLYTAKALEVLIKQNHGTIDNFDEIAKGIINDYAIKSLSIAPDGIVTNTYPLLGNEAAIGHRLLDDPHRANEATEAMNSGKLTIGGPYELIQGGFGIVGRQPVYLKNDQGEQFFWGFTCVVLRFPEALQDAELETLEDRGYSYELWRIQPDTNDKQIIQASSTTLSGQPQTCMLSLPNSTWYLSMTLKNGWIDYGVLFIYIVLILIFTCLITALYHELVILTKSRNELRISILQQSKNYHSIQALNEELSVFRHDIKNHTITLLNLLTNHQTKEAIDYIHSIQERGPLQAVSIQNTENYVLDALIATKHELALQKHIHMETHIALGRRLKMDNMDCSSLFGNLIDNAIEACEQSDQTTPFIRLFMNMKGNMLYVRITNTSSVSPKIVDGSFTTTKKDKQSHGYGTKTIQTIIKKYKGTINYSYNHQSFTVSFILMDV